MAEEYWDYSPDSCPTCGLPLVWEDCWNGCDDGYFDEYDYDPINYSPGEYMRPCDICHGIGGYWICANGENHKTEAVMEDTQP